MDNIIYNSIFSYYQALEKLGNYSYSTVYRLLILCFYRDFVFSDYRGVLSRNDYHEIEKALNCLFGTDCLIPYPDYLKMGKLHIGEMTEMAHRLQALEDTKVLKAGVLEDGDDTLNSDVILIQGED